MQSAFASPQMPPQAPPQMAPPKFQLPPEHQKILDSAIAKMHAGAIVPPMVEKKGKRK